MKLRGAEHGMSGGAVAPVGRATQRGMVLIMSLLLLLVVTLLAVAMFRGMGLDAKIAGNVREKQRALHSAVSAEQYAEYWLSSSGNSGTAATLCNTQASANSSTPLICTNIPYGPTSTTLDATHFNPAAVPWSVSGAAVGFTYTPGLSTAVVMNVGAPASGSAANYYYAAPGFYISYLGPSGDGLGTVYQIDAYGYGGTADSVAVVESTYEVQSGVKNLGGP